MLGENSLGEDGGPDDGGLGDEAGRADDSEAEAEAEGAPQSEAEAERGGRDEAGVGIGGGGGRGRHGQEGDELKCFPNKKIATSVLLEQTLLIFLTRNFMLLLCVCLYTRFRSDLCQWPRQGILLYPSLNSDRWRRRALRSPSAAMGEGVACPVCYRLSFPSRVANPLGKKKCHIFIEKNPQMKILLHNKGF